MFPQNTALFLVWWDVVVDDVGISNLIQDQKRTEKKVKLAQDLQLVQNNTKLLSEMLAHFVPGRDGFLEDSEIIQVRVCACVLAVYLLLLAVIYLWVHAFPIFARQCRSLTLPRVCYQIPITLSGLA